MLSVSETTVSRDYSRFTQGAPTTVVTQPTLTDGRQGFYAWKGVDDVFEHRLAISPAPPIHGTSQIPHDADRPESRLDRSIIETGFDCSCLDALDDVLIQSPLDSFTNLCWEEAVRNDPGPSRFIRNPLNDDSSDDESDGQSDLTPTPSLIWEGDSSADHSDNGFHAMTHCTSGECKPRPPPFIRNITLSQIPPFTDPPTHFLKSPHDNDEKSFMFLEPHFTTCDPSESVHFFPTPRIRMKTHEPKYSRVNNLANLYSNLSARFGKSSAST